MWTVKDSPWQSKISLIIHRFDCQGESLTDNRGVRNRDYKEFAKGSVCHVFNRGNNKERIFFGEQDYRSFLFRVGVALGKDHKLLNEESLLNSPKSRVRITGLPPGLFKIHSFCLMPSHFHLLIEQLTDISISKFMSKVSTSFAMYMNKKYRRVGNIFQDCFKSVPIKNDSQLMWIISYIHMNPVKDRITSNPYDYKWSSYNDFAADRDLSITCKDLVLPLFGSKEAFIKQNYFLSKDMSRGILDNEPTL